MLKMFNEWLLQIILKYDSKLTLMNILMMFDSKYNCISMFITSYSCLHIDYFKYFLYLLMILDQNLI